MVNCGERWLDAEIQFLRDNFHQGIHYCSERLGRSIPGIRKRARKLGLIKAAPVLEGYRKGPRKVWRERAKCSI